MNNFQNHNRFKYPENIVRVTAGYGGESLLIFGEEKTALYDCGMAYCHSGLTSNIKNALRAWGRDGIDYVLMSHTHYDHIGALPYILEEWPSVKVIGAAKAASVFASIGAGKTMKRLGEVARDSFTDSDEPIKVDGLRLDIAVKEGDRIEMGKDEYFYVLEAKGHTDCSMVYVFEPDGILFASESTGVLKSADYMTTAILKSYQDTIDTAEKCKGYNPKRVIVPHYGILPEGFEREYFDMYIRFAEDEKNFILMLYDEGLNYEQIMEKFQDKYWTEERGKGQPKAAFLENAKYTIKHITEVFRNA